MQVKIYFLFIIFLIANTNLNADQLSNQDLEDYKSLREIIADDYLNFYSQDRLLRLGIGFGVGGIMANTNIDKNLQSWYQSNVRNHNTDQVAKVSKLFGEGTIMIPVALLGSSLDYFYPQNNVSKWGKKTCRVYLVGAPALLVMQRVTGGSRPGEADYNSRWHPFKDNNGVSGHAFMGAVPFLVLSNMYNDNHFIKYFTFLASFATAYSRVNDNAHYFSQALLGWYMAYESVGAVNDTDAHDSFTVMPLMKKDYYGFQVCLKY